MITEQPKQEPSAEERLEQITLEVFIEAERWAPIPAPSGSDIFFFEDDKLEERLDQMIAAEAMMK
jgi:hypothetical protein